jgi:hypothetical protein
VDIQKKAVLYKYMFLFSTVSGAMGVYFLFFKDTLHILGWALVSVWAVLAVLVRVFILKDKKYFKNNKI